MKNSGRGSVLRGKSGRGLVAVLALLLAGSLQAVPAFAGSASPGDTVIDNFTAGSGSWSACGNSTFLYYQDLSIIGGARELEMRDGGSCHFGPYPARMAIDATQGTAVWYGNHTYSPEQVFSYGTEIGTHDYPWSLSPNKGKGAPLHLHLSLGDDVLIQMVQVANPFLGIRLRDGNGNTYARNLTLVVGTNLVPLSSFSGLTAAAAANINGISFTGSENATPGDVVSLFAIHSGDTTPPAAAPTQTPAANSSGWNNSDVTVNWNWTDAGSGIDLNNCTQSSTSNGEGTLNLSSTCQDLAGNVASASYTVKVDKTRPSASPVASPAPNGWGWNNTDVTANWNWTDAGSGIDLNNCTQSSTSSGEGTSVPLSSTCSDFAGNPASASLTVSVDKTRPTVTFAGNAGTYTVAQSVSISCSASDALSGVDSVLSSCPSISAPAWSLDLGTTTLNAKVFDIAGNITTASNSFTVTVDEASLCSLVKKFSTNSGIASGLCAKLDAAAAAEARGQSITKANDLNAFENQVAAQSGKALTADQSTLLIEFAKTL